MGLETGTYIDDLVTTNPVSATDLVRNGADHIRLLKSLIKNSFAGAGGVVLVSAVDAGTLNSVVLTPTPAITEYTTRMLIVWHQSLTSTSTTPTINVSGLGAKTIVSSTGNALAAGDLVANRVYVGVYDGTYVQLTAVTQNYIDQIAFTSALPALSGNDGKYLKVVSGTAQWILAPASGGTSITGDTTLTASSDSAITVTPSGYGLYATLPSATTCAEGCVLFSIYNAGEYDFGIKNSAGTKLGWVRPKTSVIVGLSDNSTSGGVWVLHGAEKTAVTDQYYNSTITQSSGALTRVALDANRTCFVFGNTSHYAIIYNASTKTWGSATLIRASAGGGLFAAVLSATDQVLVVSCDATTGLEAVTLTISGTTVTVNTGTKATATLAANISAMGRCIAVGSSFVVSYSRTTPASGIRAITISGTAPTIGAESALSGTALPATLYASGSIVRTLSVTSSSFIYAKPYTVSGSTLSAGTEASAATTGGTVFRSFVNGNGNIVCHYTNTTHYATIFKLTSTTEAASSVSLGTVSGSIVDYTDYAAITSSKTVFVSTPSSSPLWYANILTDSSGTASAGTEISGYISALAVSGNAARFFAGENGGQLTLDCSGSSPTLTSVTNLRAATGSVAKPKASNKYGEIIDCRMYAGSNAYVVSTSTAAIYDAMYSTTAITRNNVLPMMKVDATDAVVGATQAEIFAYGATSGTTTGFSIMRIEAAA
jgi:hypothetical protein